MKFKIDSKLFVSVLKQIGTKGQLKLDSVNDNLIKSAIISTGEAEIYIAGRDIGATTYCRAKVECTVEEEGKVFISDLQGFAKNINSIEGKIVTISVVNGECIINGANGEDGFGIQAVDEFDDLEKWDSCNVKINDTIHYHDDKVDYDYTPWFSVADGRTLSQMSEVAYEKCKVGVISIETNQDGIHISAKNPPHKLRSSRIITASKVMTEKLFTIGQIFPVMNSAIGETVVYFYIMRNGNVRLWVVSRNTEWMVKYNFPKGSDKDADDKAVLPSNEESNAPSD